jgi:hypothetical protein
MSEKKVPSVNESDRTSELSSEKTEAVVPQALAADAKVITARGNIITKDGVVVSTQESNASLSGNIFEDPEVKAYYIDVYEKAKYECRHVFDADLTWTKEEEKKLVRKLDLRGELPLIDRMNLADRIFSLSLGLCYVLCSTSRPW